MLTAQQKRGDTWALRFTRTDSNGNAVDLTGMTVEAALISPTSATTAFAVSVTDAASGALTLTMAASTTLGFSPGVYHVDVEFQDGGTVISSETFGIVVIEDVTNAP